MLNNRVRPLMVLVQECQPKEGRVSLSLAASLCVYKVKVARMQAGMTRRGISWLRDILGGDQRPG
jgi:hypothetical protein